MDIVSCVVDTNVLLRITRRADSQHHLLRYGGVQVHDARLAAAMYVHGVAHILTLNVADFSRFSGLTPVHPNQL